MPRTLIVAPLSRRGLVRAAAGALALPLLAACGAAPAASPTAAPSKPAEPAKPTEPAGAKAPAEPTKP
ncbi:MAG TPA: hypothetical protein VGL23_17645, partial [Chloroflexota bacterium]